MATPRVSNIELVILGYLSCVCREEEGEKEASSWKVKESSAIVDSEMEWSKRGRKESRQEKRRKEGRKGERENENENKKKKGNDRIRKVARLLAIEKSRLFCCCCKCEEKMK